MANHFLFLQDKHEYHRESHGMWMYRVKDGVWNTFIDDCHFANTVNYAMDCEVAFFTQVPNMGIPAAIL